MKNFFRICFVFLSVSLLFSCSRDDLTGDDNAGDQDDKSAGSPSADSVAYNPTWTFYSHGNAAHDYNMVFPQDIVNRLEIIMTADTWKKIRANMTSIYGYDFGQRMGGGGNKVVNETDYADVLLKFNDKSWKNAGFRLKGNSSLSLAWGQGNYKLPFRLNFDKFEETYPAIKNQHFYGFKELTFSPGMKDPSLQREKITADLFRMAGVPAARTAFYRIYIDFGTGLNYCGVYTAVEIPEDNMVKSQFGEEKGNIYKPESRLVYFNIADFEKKNNETVADYTDVRNFLTALNNPLRTTNPEMWRKNFEAVFNVDHFLRYLAVNNAIVNWDSYGNMAHNYYLYNHSVKKLTWIPWDHNEALTGNPGITGTVSGPGGPGGDPANKGLSLSMNEVQDSWPLIRFLISDEVYFSTYRTYLKWFKDSVFTTAEIHAMLDRNYNLIAPYAIGAEGEKAGYTYLSGAASFNSALVQLKNHVVNRRNLISSWIP